jgi:hypothetical protein
MAGKSLKISYPIKTIIGELIICGAITTLALFFQNMLPSQNVVHFAVNDFINSSNGLNAGLIFAMFLAIFMSDSSSNIKDARKHSAFIQPVIIVLANSLLLCGLSLLTTDVRWLRISLVAWAIVFLISNMRFAWKMLALSRDR